VLIPVVLVSFIDICKQQIGGTNNHFNRYFTVKV